eukprot:11205574-Heterocapsa_arctica.AAC.1
MKERTATSVRPVVSAEKPPQRVRVPEEAVRCPSDCAALSAPPTGCAPPAVRPESIDSSSSSSDAVANSPTTYAW